MPLTKISTDIDKSKRKETEEIDYGGCEMSSTGGFSEQIRPMSAGFGQEDPVMDKGM